MTNHLIRDPFHTLSPSKSQVQRIHWMQALDSNCREGSKLIHHFNTAMVHISAILIASLLGSITLASASGSTQPIRKAHCPGVYEFYGHPDPHSGLQILYVMAGRQDDLTACWSRIQSRMGGSTALKDYLSNRAPSAADQRLLKETAARLGFQSPYVHNLGI